MNNIDIKIALDAMGGDFAPAETVKGAVNSLEATDRVKLMLTGNETLIRGELSKYSFDETRIEIINTTEIIEMAEPPVAAIRTKKDSSLVRGLRLVKEGVCQAFVSAGSTGAVLAGAQVYVGKAKGVMRTPLAPLIPTAKGVTLLIDCGANVDARPACLVQFAKMGSLYMRDVCGVKNPKVGILNIGAEEEKGNALVKETFPLLKECTDIHFVGSVEARDIPFGEVDVAVCEAFTGNVLLKTYEGVGSVLISTIKEGLTKTTRSKIGALLVKPALKETLKAFDAQEYGGAPMLGLKGLVVKTHGNAKAGEIRNTILQCETFLKQDLNRKIEAALSNGI